MKIIKKKPLVDFYEKHADAKTPLEEWHSKTKKQIGATLVIFIDGNKRTSRMVESITS